MTKLIYLLAEAGLFAEAGCGVSYAGDSAEIAACVSVDCAAAGACTKQGWPHAVL